MLSASTSLVAGEEVKKNDIVKKIKKLLEKNINNKHKLNFEHLETYELAEEIYGLIMQYKKGEEENVCVDTVSNMLDGWIRTDDVVPKEDTEVLVYAPECNIIGSILIGKYFQAEKKYNASWAVYDFGEALLNAKVTHWMPLPEEPII